MMFANRAITLIIATLLTTTVILIIPFRGGFAKGLYCASCGYDLTAPNRCGTAQQGLKSNTRRSSALFD